MAVKLNVADLIDRAEITDTLLCYARGIDRRDWTLFRSIFTDVIAIDYTSWSGLCRDIQADDWVQAVSQGLSGFDATQHTLTNILIERDGDAASCNVNMTAAHFLDGAAQRLGGYYVFRCLRTESGWKVTGARLVITWMEGDRAIFELAATRVKD